VISEDPVLDFMVMEAVYMKVLAEDAKAEKEAAARKWRKDTSSLNQHR
jgi:hypothetical protein